MQLTGRRFCCLSWCRLSFGRNLDAMTALQMNWCVLRTGTNPNWFLGWHMRKPPSIWCGSTGSRTSSIRLWFTRFRESSGMKPDRGRGWYECVSLRWRMRIRFTPLRRIWTSIIRNAMRPINAFFDALESRR